MNVSTKNMILSCFAFVLIAACNPTKKDCRGASQSSHNASCKTNSKTSEGHEISGTEGSLEQTPYISTTDISKVYYNGLSMEIKPGIETIAASYLRPGTDMLEEKAPESERIFFNLTNVKSSDLLKAIGQSRLCSETNSAVVSHCGDRSITVFRSTATNDYSRIFLEKTDCSSKYNRICEDTGLENILKKAFTEKPKESPQNGIDEISLSGKSFRRSYEGKSLGSPNEIPQMIVHTIKFSLEGKSVTDDAPTTFGNPPDSGSYSVSQDVVTLVFDGFNGEEKATYRIGKSGNLLTLTSTGNSKLILIEMDK